MGLRAAANDVSLSSQSATPLLVGCVSAARIDEKAGSGDRPICEPLLRAQVARMRVVRSVHFWARMEEQAGHELVKVRTLGAEEADAR
jgi:hypothetical protein